MRTSSARNNNWQCPQCHVPTTRDLAGRGFVRHTTSLDPDDPCNFERGWRDDGQVVDLPEMDEAAGDN